MQRTLISLLAVATGFFGTASAAPQAPQISECSANCFLSSYPELMHGCAGDNTYMTCICKDPSKLSTVKGCLSSCSDESSQQIAQVLSPEICGSTQPGSQPGSQPTGSQVVTVTDTVTVSCSTTGVSQPTVIVPPVQSQSAEVPPHTPEQTQPPAQTAPPAQSQPPAETQPPVQTPPIIPPVETQTLTTAPTVIVPIAGTTGAIPTPGTNTTITTGQPTQPSTPAAVPSNQPSEGGTAGKFGVSYAVAALAGAVGIFAAL